MWIKYTRLFSGGLAGGAGLAAPPFESVLLN